MGGMILVGLGLMLWASASGCGSVSDRSTAESSDGKEDKKTRPPSVPENGYGIYPGVCHYGYALKGQFDPDIGPAKAVENLAKSWDDLSGIKHPIQQFYSDFPNKAGIFPSFETGFSPEPSEWELPIRDFCQGVYDLGATPYISLHPKSRFELFYTKWGKGNEAYEATVKLAIAIGKLNGPIFIDFAREANGWWDVYSILEMQEDGVPVRLPQAAENYQIAYENFSGTFKQYAPNVAMVFNVNQGYLGVQGSAEERDNFTPLTPSPKAFDWVSTSIYSADFSFVQNGGKLWGGLLGWMITHDDADDPQTPTQDNESVNWYKYYGEQLQKPLIIESVATATHRLDVYPNPKQRADMSHQLKAGYWNKEEYGWIGNLFATSNLLPEQADLYNYKIDAFPQVHAIIIQQTANWEAFTYVEMPWADFRIGFNEPEPPSWASQPGDIVYNKEHPVEYDLTTPWYYPEEIELYKSLLNNNYFVKKVYCK